jgi:YD repeat-containing protein
MPNFMLQQAHSPVHVALSQMIFHIRQIGALLCTVWLLAFCGVAWGDYTQDVLPKPAYQATCMGGFGTVSDAEISKVIDKCTAIIKSLTRSDYPHVGEPSYTNVNFYVGSPLNNYIINGDPASYGIDGYFTVASSGQTINCNNNCGNISVSSICPLKEPNFTSTMSLQEKVGYPNRVLICRGITVPEDRGPQRRCPIDKSVTPAPDITTQLFGNPVDAATGVKLQPEIDYSGPDGLVFERTYRSSLGQFASVLNSGWTQPQTANSALPGNRAACYSGVYKYNNEIHSYCFPYSGTSSGFTQAPGAYQHYLQTSSGQSLLFNDPSNNGSAPVAKADTNIRVVRNTDAATQNLWLWELTLEDDSHERYSADGRLVARWPRSGSAQQVTYTYSDDTTPTTVAPLPGLLIRITNAFGRSLNFTYNMDGQMVNMTDPNNGIYTYAYDNYNNLTQVTYPDDTPDVASDNPKRIYLYEDSRFPHALTGITDEAGTPPYATFQYEAQNLNDTRGRAISTEHAGAVEKYTFAYNTDGSTTVTDPLNTPRTYTYTTLLGVKRVTGMTQPCATCGSSAASTTYDANGNVASRTDFNGTQTTYAYDLTRNLETSRIEAVGTPEQRTITTEWHPAYRLPVRIAEPNRRTTFVYHGDTVVNGTTTTTLTCGATGALCRKTVQATNDANGGQGFSPTPTGTRTWNYTYNSRGQILTVNGPRGDMNDVTSHTYYAANDPVVDNRKLLKTVTNALGQITTYNTYDAHGRPTRITDPNGVVTDLVYDARGRLTNLTRGGLTTTLAYTSYGALWKVTTPAAGTVTYGYDNAHRLTSITNGASEKIVYTLDNQGNRTKEQTFAADGTVAATLNRQFDALGRLWKILNKDNTGNPGIRLRCRGQPDR